MNRNFYGRNQDEVYEVSLSNALYITDGTIETYTFPIQTIDSLTKYNLMLNLKNGEYKPYLIHYDLTDEEYLAYSEGQFIDFSTKAIGYELESDNITITNRIGTPGSTCTQIELTRVELCDCPQHQAEHIYGGENCHGRTEVWETVMVPCPGGGGGGEGDGLSGTPSGGPGSPGGTYGGPSESDGSPGGYTGFVIGDGATGNQDDVDAINQVTQEMDAAFGVGNWSFEDEYIQSYFNNEINLEQVKTLHVIENLANPMNGDPIEFYLIAKYKNNELLNINSIQAFTSEQFNAGEYTLTPHKLNGVVKYYTAIRYNENVGIEYIIRPDGLQNFIDNINFYKLSANWFYMNGIPSAGQIAYASGDYSDGLVNMWNDAIHSPEWWAYAIVSFAHAVTALPPNTTVGSTLTNNQWRISMRTMRNDMFQGKVVTNNQGVSVSIYIPDNYVARIVDNGKGIKFVPQGTPLNSDANAIRIMEPTTTGTYPHPKGYVKFYNSNGHPINPNNGQTLGNANNHFDFP